MKQSTALWFSAGVTAFMLVVAGGVITRLNGAQAEPAQAQTAAAPAADGLAQPAPHAERDRQRQTAPQALQAAPEAPGATLSADQAAMIAARLARGASVLKAPELVDYGGATAYEVTLNAGTIYINAHSGAILGVVPAQNPQAFQRRGERGERSSVRPFVERAEHDEEDDDHE